MSIRTGCHVDAGRKVYFPESGQMRDCMGRMPRMPRGSAANSREERMCSNETSKSIPVAMRLGETPVPIPNTMVKTQAADGTILETVWESRWLPD